MGIAGLFSFIFFFSSTQMDTAYARMYYLEDVDEEYYDGEKDISQTSSESDLEEGEWRKKGEKWYYYNDSGKLVKGWIDNGNIYYTDPSTGVRQNGWQVIDQGTFFFDKNGRLKTGWRTRDGSKYYLNETGKLGKIGRAASGWKTLKGKRFHFEQDGRMSVGELPIGKDVFYFKETGEQIVGWVPFENGVKRYYYTKQDKGKKWGQPAQNIRFRGRFFTPDGLSSPSIEYGAAILDQVGWNLRSAYGWSSGLSYSGQKVYLEPMGSELLARQGFEHHTGNCYVMAATFYIMAECLGFDAHQIAGAVPSSRGGLGNHSWVEIDEDGGTWAYDPNCTMETRADRFRFRYGTPGTWRYLNYHRMN